MEAQIKLEREHKELLEKQKNVMYPVTQVEPPASSEKQKNGKLQKSHVFQKLVQNQRNKYEIRLQEERSQRVSIDSTEKNNQLSTKNSTLATSDRKASLNPGSESIKQIKTSAANVKTINNDDYEERQRQLRIKYGSNKTKMKTNYYSSRMSGVGHQQIVAPSSRQSVQETSKTRNQRPSSTSSSGLNNNNLARQKSTSSVNSQLASAPVSSRLMAGTASSINRKSQVQTKLKPKQVGTVVGQGSSRVYNR